MESSRTLCNLSRVLEFVAIERFQFYVKSQTESLLLIQLTVSSMAVDFKRSELLRTYGDVVSFPLRTYATDELIAKAYNDVAGFCQSLQARERPIFESYAIKSSPAERYSPTGG